MELTKNNSIFNERLDPQVLEMIDILVLFKKNYSHLLLINKSSHILVKLGNIYKTFYTKNKIRIQNKDFNFQLTFRRYDLDD